jgi:hypothetical protein
MIRLFWHQGMSLASEIRVEAQSYTTIERTGSSLRIAFFHNDGFTGTTLLIRPHVQLNCGVPIAALLHNDALGGGGR